jgi:hypothetical protein
LEKFELAVFGTCGCNGWEVRAGLPESIEEQPVQA